MPTLLSASGEPLSESRGFSLLALVKLVSTLVPLAAFIMQPGLLPWPGFVLFLVALAAFACGWAYRKPFFLGQPVASAISTFVVYAILAGAAAYHKHDQARTEGQKGTAIQQNSSSPCSNIIGGRDIAIDCGKGDQK